MTACQRWRPDRTHTWRHTSEGGFNPDLYGVTAIHRKVAKDFVTLLHYSGTYPADRLMFGLYDLAGKLPELVGVAILSVPASEKVLTSVFPRLEPFDESLELGRPVLREQVPANAESARSCIGYNNSASSAARRGCSQGNLACWPSLRQALDMSHWMRQRCVSWDGHRVS